VPNPASVRDHILREVPELQGGAAATAHADGV
jgi:hypothetical protein